ncbi:MAG: hypothetical protein QOE90_200 [Thermoplasmata archaeon]|nr:hypothetical protein [Thermoplasmata archaeon]
MALRASRRVEKRDLAIVLAGALLVAGATAYAGAQGPSTHRYQLTYAATSFVIPQGTEQRTLPGPGYRSGYSIATSDWNVSSYHAEFNVTPAGAFVAGASLHAKLTTPNGTTIEKDGTVGPAGGVIHVAFDVPVAPLPAPRIVDASSQKDALAMLEQGDRVNAGNWTVELDFSPGTPEGPEPAIGFYEALVVWIGGADALVPAAK